MPQVDYNRYWEGMTTLEMIYETQRHLGVAPGDFDRYTKADIVRALNRGGIKFAKATACLPYPVAIRLKTNRQNYRLPYGSLKVLSARYYSGDSASEYTELHVLNDPKKMQRIDRTYRGTAGTPEYCFPSYVSGNVSTIGFSPIPTADGDRYDTDSFGLLTASTGLEFTGSITGTHKTGYAASAFLVDADGRDLVTLGALVGWPVFNTTTGESATITSIADQDATNDRVNGTLSGAGVWTPGDAYSIPMSNFGVVLDVVDNNVWTLSSYYGTVADVISYNGNVMLDVARAPLALSEDLDNVISEIPDNYQEAQVAYAVHILGRGAFKGMVQMDKAMAALTLFNSMVDEYNKLDEQFVATENAVEHYEW